MTFSILHTPRTLSPLPFLSHLAHHPVSAPSLNQAHRSTPPRTLNQTLHLAGVQILDQSTAWHGYRSWARYTAWYRVSRGGTTWWDFCFFGGFFDFRDGESLHVQQRDATPSVILLFLLLFLRLRRGFFEWSKKICRMSFNFLRSVILGWNL